MIRCLVDIQNLYIRIADKYNGRRLDFKLLAQKITYHYDVNGYEAYGLKPGLKNRIFVEALKNFDYTVRPYSDTYLIDMIVDTVRDLDKIETLILCSTNMAMMPFLKLLKERGKQIVIVAALVPKELQELANHVIEIDETLLFEDK